MLMASTPTMICQMRMIRQKVRMIVAHSRDFRRPDSHRRDDPDDRDTGEEQRRDWEPETRARPARYWIGDQPAGVRERELRRENRGSVLDMRRAT